MADRVQDRPDARARSAPVALEELRGLVGRADRVAERLVEGDLARATIEVADVQPVEVRSRLAPQRRAARLLGQLPCRDHAWVEAGQLGQSTGELGLTR